VTDPSAAVPAAPPADGARSRTGRARAFRQRQVEQRTSRRTRIANLVMVGLVVAGAYLIVTERPGVLLNAAGTTRFGPAIVVQLGTPTAGTLSCAGGGTAAVERVPWVGSTQPVATGEVYVRIYEIWDGDVILDPNVVANATASNPCAGAPPSSALLWYLVLAAPNGTNELTYTQAGLWQPVAGGAANVTVANDSTLLLVSGASLAGTGRGIAVLGFAGLSPISGSVPL